MVRWTSDDPPLSPTQHVFFYIIQTRDCRLERTIGIETAVFTRPALIYKTLITSIKKHVILLQCTLLRIETVM